MRVAQYVRGLASLAFVSMVALFALSACGGDGAAAEQTTSTERPVVVATTGILGDIVANLAGDQFDVVTIMPTGTDPHNFQPSAQDIAMIDSASAVIVNGAAFEEGLLDALHAAEENGAPLFEAITAVATLDATDAGHDHHDHGDDDDAADEDHDEHGDEDHDDEDDDHDDEDHDDHGDDDHEDHGDEDHDEHEDEDHGDEDHDDHEDEDHGDEDHDDHEDEDEDHDDHGGEGAVDPHFFTDPARMAIAVEEITDFLIANVDSVDAEELRATSAEYVDVLTALDAEVETALADVPDSKRVLVTNHQVFSYFADRYDFEVIGTVVPSGSTDDGVSGRRLADLAELLESEGVSVIFTDTSASDELAQTLANEVGDVSVVKLFTESLGGPESDGSTYVDMVRNNALEIAAALGE